MHKSSDSGPFDMELDESHIFTAKKTGKNVLNSKACWHELCWGCNETETEEAIHQRIEQIHAQTTIHVYDGDNLNLL